MEMELIPLTPDIYSKSIICEHRASQDPLNHFCYRLHNITIYGAFHRYCAGTRLRCASAMPMFPMSMESTEIDLTCRY
jgi:hypothetical protein